MPNSISGSPSTPSSTRADSPLPLPIQAAEPAMPPVVEPDESSPLAAPSNEKAGLLNHKGLRQFIKFCIVGASSTVVTFAVLKVAYTILHLPLFASLTDAFFLSVVNGFIWNRLWTFKEARGNSSGDQSMKFLAVNLVGYILNTSIVVLVVAHFSASQGLFGSGTELKAILYNILAGDKKSYPPMLVYGAQLFAITIVVWWNYFANRRWTFKH